MHSFAVSVQAVTKNDAYRSVDQLSGGLRSYYFWSNGSTYIILNNRSSGLNSVARLRTVCGFYMDSVPISNFHSIALFTLTGIGLLPWRVMDTYSEASMICPIPVPHPVFSVQGF